MAHELLELLKLYKLKEVSRSNSVKGRKENSAEHTFSSLILSDYFIKKLKIPLNKERVISLILYHDIPEIITGDLPLIPSKSRQNKDAAEVAAAKRISEHLEHLKNLPDLIKEFHDCLTPESKFANAIDKFDAVLHEVQYKQDWKGWTKEFLISNKLPYFIPFPQIKKEFEDLLAYLEKEGYFSL